MRRFCTSVLFVAAWSLLSMNAHAGIMNGDFSEAGTPPIPFEYWESFVTPPENGDGVQTGFARFKVIDAANDVQLEQEFPFPNNAITLSFEFRLTSSGGGTQPDVSPPEVLDRFQASLLDADNFDSLFAFDPTSFAPPPSDPPGLPITPGFFRVDNDGAQYFDPKFVSVQPDIGGGFSRVSLDVSSLPSQLLILEFLAQGQNDGFLTEFDVDNVVLATQSQSNVVPEPVSLLVWSTGAAVGGILLRKRRRRPASCPGLLKIWYCGRYGFILVLLLQLSPIFLSFPSCGRPRRRLRPGGAVVGRHGRKPMFG